MKNTESYRKFTEYEQTKIVLYVLAGFLIGLFVGAVTITH